MQSIWIKENEKRQRKRTGLSWIQIHTLSFVWMSFQIASALADADTSTFSSSSNNVQAAAE
ncbi:MAG: hypothetical protein WCH11_06205, partial [Bdellovibrio sp.]